MDPLERFPEAFSLAGAVRLNACPVCGSADIGELWRLPQNRLSVPAHLTAPGSPADGFYLQYLPTLEAPQKIYRFDMCGQCETIFLNPKFDDHAHYLNDASKVQLYRDEGLTPVLNTARAIIDDLPPGASLVVELACGGGQLLDALRQARPAMRYVGMELSAPSVAFIRDELGFDAHQVDLDHDDLDAIVPPGTADYVIAQEAFEHVRAPAVLLQKMARMLRPGGRAYLTAQFWGDNPLQIRVGEPIYINDKGLAHVLDQAGLQLARLRKDVKMRAFLAKSQIVSDSVQHRPFAELLARTAEVAPSYAWNAKRRAVLDRAIESIDRDRWQALRDRYAAAITDYDRDGPFKYADLPLWIARHTETAWTMGLNEGGPYDILDLGMGAGHFGAVAAAMGHRYVGTDVSVPFYDEVADLLGVDRRIAPVSRGVAQPDFGRKFDVASIIWQSFDYDEVDGVRRYWTLGDWLFLLADLADHQLKRGGRIFVQLNKIIAPDGEYHDPALMRWAKARGAVISEERGELLFLDVRPSSGFFREDGPIPSQRRRATHILAAKPKKRGRSWRRWLGRMVKRLQTPKR